MNPKAKSILAGGLWPRNFRLDLLPRGRIAGKLFFGAKVAALNFRKLLRFLGGARPRIAENPLLA